MEKFGVYLRSRGTCLDDGTIRVHYTLKAVDDVEAAMLAKEKARKKHKSRAEGPWYVDHVEKMEAV